MENGRAEMAKGVHPLINKAVGTKSNLKQFRLNSKIWQSQLRLDFMPDQELKKNENSECNH